MRIRAVLLDGVDKGRIIARAGAGARIVLPEDRVRPDGISAQVMRTGEPAVFKDIQEQQTRFLTHLIEAGTRAYCCLPLSIQGKPIGVMSFHYNTPRDFPEFEIQALQLYVNHAATAYDSARRMETLEAIRHAAEALARVTSRKVVCRQSVGAGAAVRSSTIEGSSERPSNEG